jgi:hypothetical protein
MAGGKAEPPVDNNFPGAIRRTSIATDAGFAVSGTMAWIVDSDRLGGRVAIEIGPQDGPRFEYLVRDGSTDRIRRSPMPSVAPAATPTTGVLQPDTSAILARDGALLPVSVGGVAVVDGYPDLMPTTSGDKFVEVFVRFGAPSASYTIDPNDWVLVGPDGRVVERLQVEAGDGSLLLPWIAGPWPEAAPVQPENGSGFPLYVVAEIPSTGRITLEYRPHGGRAQVTWVLRDK